jgi:hypothetical protein
MGWSLTLALMRMPLRYTLTGVVMGLGVVNKAALQLLYNQQHFLRGKKRGPV